MPRLDDPGNPSINSLCLGTLALIRSATQNNGSKTQKKQYLLKIKVVSVQLIKKETRAEVTEIQTHAP